MAAEPLLAFVEEPDAGPEGLLVLIHGRGADEHDLVPLAAALDPYGRLVRACPRAPLPFPGGSGAHWYHLYRLGEPDPGTFLASLAALEAWLDGMLARYGLGHDRLVLGGFSQGAVMSLALALKAGRPRPAGVLALSGYIPSAPGFQVDFAQVRDLPVFIQHGTRDPVITVDWGRDARRRLEEAGARVRYHEFDGGHWVDPEGVALARAWLEEVLAAPSRRA